jgi:hypothetical protein
LQNETGDFIGNLSTSLVGILGGRYSTVALRLACSELTARGLLRDEGVGRWDAIAMNYFVSTDLATWLQNWLIGIVDNTSESQDDVPAPSVFPQ